MKYLKLIETDEDNPGHWFVTDGIVKRHVLSAESLAGSDLFGQNPEKITRLDFNKLRLASPVGRSYNRRPSRKLRSSLEMRERLTGDLKGVGVEFGAGGSPLAVPINAHTKFADVFNHDDLIQNRYNGQHLSNIVKPDFQISFEDVLDLPVNNLDYILACHVIEHLANPMKAIVGSLEKLRRGGKLLLIVPDKRKTFDRDRKLTTTRHLLEDFLNPDPKRDFAHFLDFYTNAMPPNDLSSIRDLAEKKFEDNFPIHFHTYTHWSFIKFLRMIQSQQSIKFNFWTRGPRFTEVDIEFYVSITKT